MVGYEANEFQFKGTKVADVLEPIRQSAPIEGVCTAS
jgi:hypothetical protein